MGMNAGWTLVSVVVIIFLLSGIFVQASHFRGGTINWKSEGGLKVHFYYRLQWAYDNGPKCFENLIGQRVTGMGIDYWKCKSNNCGTNPLLHDVYYICLAANKNEDWEQGKDDFTYTFPDIGPFTIGYTSGNWISLSNGKGSGDWSISTVVDLRTRSDTGTPNSSPESQSKPLYIVSFDCEIRLKLPIVDADNDKIRCRWAQGDECQSVCNALPNAQLDEETCTITFNTTSAYKYVVNGTYAVALMVEDYPRVPITLDGKEKRTPNDALSSVPVQFLVFAENKRSPCDAGPQFIPPTPEESEVIAVEEGETLNVTLSADNKNDTTANVSKIVVSGPLALIQSPLTPDVSQNDTFSTTLTWKTTSGDVGHHIVCATPTNSKNIKGDQRCFTIDIVPLGCKSAPCLNNGKCVANNGTYTCFCRSGFTGHDCEVDVDECTSILNPCPDGTYCVDGVGTFTCPNITITTTTTQPTTPERNYTGICPLEYDHCECSIRPNENPRDWMGLSRASRDALFASFGFPIGLILSALTYICCLRRCERQHPPRDNKMGFYRMG